MDRRKGDLMQESTKLIIFSHGDLYSITECSPSGIRKAIVNNGIVTGDCDLITKVGRLKPPEESIEEFLKRKTGCLVTT